MNAFISYHSPDRRAAETLARALEASGVTPFLAPWSLKPGAFWLPALARAIQEADGFVLLVGASGVGPWQLLEYYEAFSRRVREPDFPLIPVFTNAPPRLPFLHQLHAVAVDDLSTSDAAVEVMRGLRGQDAAVVRPWQIVNPYRGFSALGEADAGFFFGREQLTTDIINRLRTGSRLVTLIGPSGAGKSSIQQAGLVSSLRRQTWPDDDTRTWPADLAESRRWWYVTLQPGERPLHALARAFVALWTEPDDPARDKLARSWADKLFADRDIGPLLVAAQDVMRERFNEEPPSRFVITVDQWEQLYQRRKPDDPEARAFSATLAAANERADLVVIGSLRSDYYEQFQNDAEFSERATRVDVSPLLRVETILPVIESPARTLGVTFDPPRAARDIADDVARERGGLPILSYVLEDVWRRMQQRGDGVFAGRDYGELGGVKGALSKRLVDYVSPLDATAQQALKDLFVYRLATAEAEQPVSRRQAKRSECSAAEWVHVEALATPKWRLLTTDAVDGKAVAEVAHEHVLRVSSPIADWIAKDRTFLESKSRLESERLFWQTLGSKDEDLLQGSRLRAIASEIGDRRSSLGDVDRTFLDRSERRSRARRDADRSVQRATLLMRWSRRVMAALLTLLGIAGLLTLLITRTDWFQLRTVRQAAKADSAEFQLNSQLWAMALARDGDLKDARMMLTNRDLNAQHIPPGVALALAAEVGAAGRIDDAKVLLQDAVALDPRPSTRSDAAMQLASIGEHVEARQLLDRLEDEVRGEALLEFAFRYALIADAEHAHEILSAVPARLTLDKPKAAALAGEVHALLGERDQAEHFLSLAVRPLRNGSTAGLSDLAADERDVTMQRSAEGWALLGERRKVAAIVKESQGSPSPLHQSVNLTGIASAYALAGHFDEALSAYRDAETDTLDVVVNFLEFAVALQRRKAEPRLVATSMRLAESEVERIEDPLKKQNALVLIAVRLSQDGDMDGARRVLARAMDPARFADFRGVSLELASDLHKFDPARARAFLDARIQQANEGSSPDVAAIATQLIRIDSVDEALRLLRRARDAAGQIEAPAQWSKQLSAIAQAFARAHAYRDARLTAERCGDANDRIAAYAEIVSQHAMAQDRRLMMARESIIQDHFWGR